MKVRAGHWWKVSQCILYVQWGTVSQEVIFGSMGADADYSSRFMDRTSYMPGVLPWYPFGKAKCSGLVVGLENLWHSAVQHAIMSHVELANEGVT